MAAYTLPRGATLKNPAEIAIATAAWNAAWALYEPIHDQWDDEYDTADKMPGGPERDEAFRLFNKVHLPEYQRARDELMRVPAPTFEALAKKMRAADATSDEHHDLCLADIERLVRSVEG